MRKVLFICVMLCTFNVFSQTVESPGDHLIKSYQYSNGSMICSFAGTAFMGVYAYGNMIGINDERLSYVSYISAGLYLYSLVLHIKSNNEIGKAGDGLNKLQLSTSNNSIGLKYNF